MLAYELKAMMEDETKSAVETIFRIIRENKAKIEREASGAIRDVTEEIVHRTLAEKLVTLRLNSTRRIIGVRRVKVVLLGVELIHFI